MDYKYIEQLLERYWDCETSIEEESILRTFFSQKDVPARLLKYRSLFECPKLDADNNVLGDDFDEKVLAAIGVNEPTNDTQPQQVVVKARMIPLRNYLKPLFKAAAIVAMVLTIGDAAQWSMGGESKIQSKGQGVEMIAADTTQQVDNGIAIAVKDSVKPITSDVKFDYPASEPTTIR